MPCCLAFKLYRVVQFCRLEGMSQPTRSTLDPRLKQYTIKEAGSLLGYRARRSIYNLIEDGYLEKINPRPHVSRVTGSSLMDYLEATNAGRQPVAKYTPKKPSTQTAPGVAQKQDAAQSKAKGVLEWMGIKR
jgi:hypothetical protein